jgi:Fe2+ transport system protein FeoA
MGSILKLCTQAAFSPRQETMLTVKDVPLGTPVTITSVQGDRHLRKRVESMGLLPGRSVIVLRRVGDSVLLKAENARIAIRLTDTLHIGVHP